MSSNARKERVPSPGCPQKYIIKRLSRKRYDGQWGWICHNMISTVRSVESDSSWSEKKQVYRDSIRDSITYEEAWLAWKAADRPRSSKEDSVVTGAKSYLKFISNREVTHENELYDMFKCDGFCISGYFVYCRRGDDYERVTWREVKKDDIGFSKIVAKAEFNNISYSDFSVLFPELVLNIVDRVGKYVEVSKILDSCGEVIMFGINFYRAEFGLSLDKRDKARTASSKWRLDLRQILLLEDVDLSLVGGNYYKVCYYPQNGISKFIIMDPKLISNNLVFNLISPYKRGRGVITYTQCVCGSGHAVRIECDEFNHVYHLCRYNSVDNMWYNVSLDCQDYEIVDNRVERKENLTFWTLGDTRKFYVHRLDMGYVIFVSISDGSQVRYWKCDKSEILFDWPRVIVQLPSGGDLLVSLEYFGDNTNDQKGEVDLFRPGPK